MGFLHPLLLGLGVATAVPILLHLLQRHQGPRVVFPALRYLRRAEREHARRIRLRQLLLMLLRIAAIALLASAAARPFLRAGGGSHAPTAVAIVLDNSMSTGVVSGDDRVLDGLKARALETLGRATSQDRFWLIRAGSPWEPAWPGDASETADRVRATEATWAGADLPAAVEQARAILEAGAAGRATEIQLLTDLQATGLASTPPEAAASMPLLVTAPEEPAPPNHAVSDVEIGGGAAPPAGVRTTAAVAVSGAPDSTVTIRLALEGRVVGAATPAGGSAALLALPALPAGPLWGWAETDPDALRADDRRFFAMRVPDPPAVAVSGDIGMAQSALDVLAGSGRIRTGTPASADVVLTPGASALSSIPAGATAIVLPPRSEAELPAVNRRLADAGIAWVYTAGAGPGENRLEVAESDPLRPQLAGIRVFEAFRLAPVGDPRPGADSALLRLDDGAPWIVRGERRGGGRYLLLASSLSEEASTLPASAALVPLLDRMIGVWATSGGTPASAEPGQEITLAADISEVEQPDGTLETVAPGSIYRLGPESGVYQFRANGETLAVLAVNPPARESDLRRADRARLDEVFGGFDLTRVHPADWSRTVFRSRLGSETWRAVAGLALLVLLVESFVAAAGARAGARLAGGPAAVPEPAVPPA